MTISIDTPIRSTKYRAYVKSLARMYTVRTLCMGDSSQTQGNVRLLYLGSHDDIENGRGLTTDKFSDVELMQYIGIKDKHGKDIYEGDLLFLGLGKHHLEVRWSTVGFRLFDLDTQDWHLLWAADMKRLEVIGNIWETSELLATREIA